MPFAEANGVNIYYELKGESGDPMVLIHGSWIDHSNWTRVVGGLSESFRVLTYDRRGHSKSQKISKQGSFDEDADDVADLIAQLGLAPAHVVGNSTGSVIALKLAAKRPTIFRSLIVHDPPAFGLLRSDPAMTPLLARTNTLEDVAKVLESGDTAKGARLFADFLAGPGGWDRLPPPEREILIANAATYLDETRDPLAFTVDLTGLSKFSRPSLLTYGGKSPATFRPVIEILAKAIPNSKVFVFDEAGHMPHISHPDKFVATVAAFARSSESGNL